MPYKNIALINGQAAVYSPLVGLNWIDGGVMYMVHGPQTLAEALGCMGEAS